MNCGTGCPTRRVFAHHTDTWFRSTCKPDFGITVKEHLREMTRRKSEITTRLSQKNVTPDLMTLEASTGCASTCSSPLPFFATLINYLSISLINPKYLLQPTPHYIQRWHLLQSTRQRQRATRSRSRATASRLHLTRQKPLASLEFLETKTTTSPTTSRYV
jgi:hypothetical protein